MKIVLEGNPMTIEAQAKTAEAIKPGYLLKRDANGQFIKHAVAGGNAQLILATERSSGLTRALTTAFPDGETVVGAINPRKGQGVLAAGAAAIAVDDPLESAGNGTLRKHTPQTVNEGGTASVTIQSDAIVAYAEEAVDNSGGAGEVFIKVRAR